MLVPQVLPETYDVMLVVVVVRWVVVTPPDAVGPAGSVVVVVVDVALKPWPAPGEPVELFEVLVVAVVEVNLVVNDDTFVALLAVVVPKVGMMVPEMLYCPILP